MQVVCLLRSGLHWQGVGAQKKGPSLHCCHAEVLGGAALLCPLEQGSMAHWLEFHSLEPFASSTVGKPQLSGCWVLC